MIACEAALRGPLETKEDVNPRRFKEKWQFIATRVAIAFVFASCIEFLRLKQKAPS